MAVRYRLAVDRARQINCMRVQLTRKETQGLVKAVDCKYLTNHKVRVPQKAFEESSGSGGASACLLGTT
jgi:hypothetical protein